MIKKILREVQGLIFPSAEGHSIHLALLFAVVAIATAVVASPWLDSTSRQYAGTGFGLDRTMTGSVQEPRRYTIRKSVLDELQ